MSYTIEIQSTDGTGTFSAYVAEPASGKGPALVICQEIFGVNETMRQVADRYAEEGYVAIVPDLFWRLEPGMELDYSPEGWEKAFGFFNNFDQNVGAQDIGTVLMTARTSLEACNDYPKAGVVGYCLGGKMAYLAACRTDADVSVGYALMLAGYLDLETSFPPAVAAYWQRLQQREGFQRALAAQARAATAQGVAATHSPEAPAQR